MLFRSHRDPVKRFTDLLLDQRVISVEALAELDERIVKGFDAGYEYAQASPFPEPGDVTKGLWVEDGYWQREPGRTGGTGA